MGGLWILETANLDEVLVWMRKGRPPGWTRSMP